jgi:hypothetical protein
MSKHFGYVENGSFKMLSLKYVTYRALHVQQVHLLECVEFKNNSMNKTYDVRCLKDKSPFTSCVNYESLSMNAFKSEVDSFFLKHPGINMYPVAITYPGHGMVLAFSRQYESGKRTAYFIDSNDSNGHFDPSDWGTWDVMAAIKAIRKLFNLVVVHNPLGRLNSISLRGNTGSISPGGYCMGWTLFFIDSIIRNNPTVLSSEQFNSECKLVVCTTPPNANQVCQSCSDTVRQELEDFIEEFTTDMFRTQGITWNPYWRLNDTLAALRKMACTIAREEDEEE